MSSTDDHRLAVRVKNTVTGTVRSWPRMRRESETGMPVTSAGKYQLALHSLSRDTQDRIAAGNLIHDRRVKDAIMRAKKCPDCGRL